MPEWLRKLLRIEPGISLAQWAYDRIANNWDRLVAVFIAAGGMTYLAHITEWMAAWGPVGVGSAGLAAALAVWVGMAWADSLRAKALARRAEAAAIERWRDRVDTVNPLAPEFHTKRLRLSEVVHPISQRLSNKRLIDCELIGPANLFLMGVNMTDVDFVNCDAVALRDDVSIRNAVALEHVTIIGGKIWNCTILVPQREAKKFAEMGAKFVSLTGIPEIDTQSRPSAAS